MAKGQIFPITAGVDNKHVPAGTTRGRGVVTDLVGL